MQGHKSCTRLFSNCMPGSVALPPTEGKIRVCCCYHAILCLSIDNICGLWDIASEMGHATNSLRTTTLSQLSSDWLHFENKRFQKQLGGGAASKPELSLTSYKRQDEGREEEETNKKPSLKLFI